MRRWLHRVLVFLLAVASAALVGCISATQFILAGLGSVGVEVSLADRLSMTVHDILGMAPMLFLVYGVAILVGFSVATPCSRRLPGSRQVWFTVAGAAATVGVLLLMQRLMGGMPIAGARGILGMAGQALAGAAAGWIYARMARAPMEDSA